EFTSRLSAHLAKLYSQALIVLASFGYCLNEFPFARLGTLQSIELFAHLDGGINYRLYRIAVFTFQSIYLKEPLIYLLEPLDRKFDIIAIISQKVSQILQRIFSALNYLYIRQKARIEARKLFYSSSNGCYLRKRSRFTLIELIVALSRD